MWGSQLPQIVKADRQQRPSLRRNVHLKLPFGEGKAFESVPDKDDIVSWLLRNHQWRDKGTKDKWDEWSVRELGICMRLKLNLRCCDIWLKSVCFSGFQVCSDLLKLCDFIPAPASSFSFWKPGTRISWSSSYQRHILHDFLYILGPKRWFSLKWYSHARLQFYHFWNSLLRLFYRVGIHLNSYLLGVLAWCGFG